MDSNQRNKKNKPKRSKQKQKENQSVDAVPEKPLFSSDEKELLKDKDRVLKEFLRLKDIKEQRDKEKAEKQEETVPKKRKLDDSTDQQENENLNDDTSEPPIEPDLDLMEMADFLPLGGDEESEEQKQRGAEEVKKVIPAWMKDKTKMDLTQSNQIPLSSLSSVLSPLLLNNLEHMSVTDLFPVQHEVIPYLLKFRPFGGDVCVCAPTGSGKTLMYAIPIIQSLQSRFIPRIRALIIVPTRDLVKQVKQTFLSLADKTNLKIVTLSGGKPFVVEQQKLVHPLNNGVEGTSKADIIISTPTRIVDHIRSTKGFTLEHLQFLVLDETDKLLSQGDVNEWLPVVLEDAYKGPSHVTKKEYSKEININNNSDNNCNFQLETRTYRSMMPLRQSISTTPLTKILCSATLTQDPEKLALLHISNPKFFAPSNSFEYRFPPALKLYTAVMSEHFKPLLLIHMIHKLNFKRVVCFTQTKEAANELYLVMSNLAKKFPTTGKIAQFSAHVSQKEREKLVNEFNRDELRMLISSDVLARGIDLKGVEVVINYEIPLNVKSLIHRCGRTARGGQKGIAVTLMENHQTSFFKRMINEVEKSSTNNEPQKFEYNKEELEPYKLALFEIEKEHGITFTKRSKMIKAVEEDTTEENNIENSEYSPKKNFQSRKENPTKSFNANNDMRKTANNNNNTPRKRQKQ